jgi:F-type H+-transporting ATPase subunit gamma
MSEELPAASDVLNAYISSQPMLARRSVARLVAQPSPLGASPQSTRNMATLRELELRLKSVRNIEKITKVSRIPQSSMHR